jgi:hydrogenase-4 component B
VAFFLLMSLLAYLLSGAGALLKGRHPAWGARIVPFGSLAASLFALVPVVYVLAGGSPVDFRASWSLPVGSFHLHLDQLSAWFALPVLLVSPIVSFYGAGYLRHHDRPLETDACGFFLQLLAGGMLFVLLASDGLLFLFAWEIMSIAAFFLVVFEHGDDDVRRAGWVYLVATHLGTAFLFAMFVLLGGMCGSFDFADFEGLGGVPDVVFILAVIGFGAKAGFFGLHVWLPEAHPAAPSHVSGLMSGVMIKTGIYGLLRVMVLANDWPAWWGWTFIGIGVISGVGGVIYALVQHDFKRLLAYSSVENIGIICLGIGVGVFGIGSAGPVARLAMAGALLHVLNHAVFKTGLFLGAGAVIQAVGTRDLDILGGLQKRMPVTGLSFLVASAAICGLPPLNGFVSEFLIYLASYWSVLPQGFPSVNLRVGGFVVISSLALIGGLAAMCFTKVYGTVFLGEPRSARVAGAADPEPCMAVPLRIVAALCVAFGLGGSVLMLLVSPAAARIHPLALAASDTTPLRDAALFYLNVTFAVCALAAVAYGLVRLRGRLLSGRAVRTGPTWGCGYPYGTPRMQYTASSFAQPLVVAFRSFLRTELGGDWPSGYLPGPSDFRTHTPGLFMHRVYMPVFAAFSWAAGWMRRIQHGGTHAYVFYILLALAAVLFWSLL